MNCPICEAPVIDYAPNVVVVYGGIKYHASCLDDERPDLKPDREPTSAEEDAYSALDLSYPTTPRMP